MGSYTTKMLDESTWPAFAKLVEDNGGIFGGCWCIAFHLDPKGPKGQCKPYRDTKERLVREGRAQAAMVFDGDNALGWCQFGRTQELPNIKNRKNYEAELDQLPDWRLPCFFVGKGYRKRGVAKLALHGALEEIARLGGGTVEAYPFDVEAVPTSSSFLHAGTLKMFLDEGFEQVRQIGKSQWVVKKLLPALDQSIIQKGWSRAPEIQTVKDQQKEELSVRRIEDRLKAVPKRAG